MLKKTITYTDYDGVERTEDFYFNLNKSEVMEMTATDEWRDLFNKVTVKKDSESFVSFVKALILRAYGIKSADGRKFMKPKEISEDFYYSEAYSNLFVELTTNAGSLESFVSGVLPAELSDKFNEVIHNPASLPSLT